MGPQEMNAWLERRASDSIRAIRKAESSTKWNPNEEPAGKSVSTSWREVRAVPGRGSTSKWTGNLTTNPHERGVPDKVIQAILRHEDAAELHQDGCPLS